MIQSSGILLMVIEHGAMQDQAEGACKSILLFLIQRKVSAQRQPQIQHKDIGWAVSYVDTQGPTPSTVHGKLKANTEDASASMS